MKKKVLILVIITSPLHAQNDTSTLDSQDQTTGNTIMCNGAAINCSAYQNLQNDYRIIFEQFSLKRTELEKSQMEQARQLQRITELETALGSVQQENMP